jgi:hypothetical protein
MDKEERNMLSLNYSISSDPTYLLATLIYEAETI